MKVLLLLLLPIDLVFLTIDTLRGWLRMVFQPRETACAYCGNLTSLHDATRAVAPANKYFNLWVFKLLCPCVQEKDEEVLSQRYCQRENMFDWRKRNVLFSTLLLSALWSGIGFGLVQSGLADRGIETASTLLRSGSDKAVTLREEKERVKRRETSAAWHQKAIDAGDDTDAAIKWLTQAVDADPSHLEPRLMLIDATIENQDLAEADRLAKIVREEGITHPRLHLQLALIHARMTRGDEALAEVDLALGDIADDMEQRIQAALILKLSGHTERSEMLLNEIRATDPGQVKAAVLLAAIKMGQKDVPAAWAIYDGLDEEQRKSAEAQSLRAELLLVEGDIREAISLYKKLIETYPDYLDGFIRYSALLREHNMEDKAKALAEEMLNAPQTKFRFAGHLILAQLFDKKGLHQDALQHADAVLNHAPLNLAAMVSKANALYQKKDFEKAAKLMESLAEMAPNYLNGQYLLARCYMREQKDADAIRVLSDIIAREPDSSVPVIELGGFYFKTKRFKEAHAVYEAYLKHHPDDVICINNLAVTLAEGRIFLDRALELAQQNFDRDYANPIYADALGWVLVRKNRSAEAVPLLQIATRGIPGHPEPRYHLGRAYLQMGDKAAALKEIKLALELSNTFAGIEDAKQLLSELQTEAP